MFSTLRNYNRGAQEEMSNKLSHVSPVVPSCFFRWRQREQIMPRTHLEKVRFKSDLRESTECGFRASPPTLRSHTTRSFSGLARGCTQCNYCLSIHPLRSQYGISKLPKTQFYSMSVRYHTFSALC